MSPKDAADPSPRLFVSAYTRNSVNVRRSMTEADLAAQLYWSTLSKDVHSSARAYIHSMMKSRNKKANLAPRAGRSESER